MRATLLSVSGNATGSSTLTVDGGGLTIGGNDPPGTLDISSGTVTTIGGGVNGSIDLSGASLTVSEGAASSGSFSVKMVLCRSAKALVLPVTPRRPMLAAAVL